MNFFIPQVDTAAAETVYGALASLAGGSPDGPRIRALEWIHEGRLHRCAVGEPIPGVQVGRAEPVLAIIKVSRPNATYKLCTAGDEFVVPAEACQQLELFDVGLVAPARVETRDSN